MSINPTLASTLLDLELEHDRHTAAAGGGIWRTGVKELDRELPWNLWRRGRIFGIGEAKGGNVKASSRSPSLPLEIISTHILECKQRHGTTAQDAIDSGVLTTVTTNVPSVYIISPPSSVNATIQALHSTLVCRLKQEQKANLQQRNKTINQSIHDLETEAEDLLSAISILPTLDLAGLADSLSEVSSSLLSPPPPPPPPPLVQEQSKRHNITDSSSQNSDCSAIVLIQWLSSFVLNAQRRSGTVQSAALLSSILGSLRHLSRTRSRPSTGHSEKNGEDTGAATNYAATSQTLQLLVLVELDMTSPRPSASLPAQSGATAAAVAAKGLGHRHGLSSAFATTSGALPFQLAMFATGGSAGSGAPAPAPGAVLGRLVLDALDTVIVVHDADGKTTDMDNAEPARREQQGLVSGKDTGKPKRVIVEVVRDAVGDAFGNWAVWNIGLGS